MAPCPPRLLAVLLLAGLSVASAALPKHPFFRSGSVQAGAKDYHYDDYDTTKLCLQNTQTCFSGFDNFAIQLGCCSKDYYHRDDSMLDLTSLGAGWCVFHQEEQDTVIPGTSTYIWSQFQGQCFLHNSGDCELGECENSVMHVEGVVTFESDAVFDSNYVPAVGCNVDADDGFPRSSNNTKTMQDWVEGMRKELGIAAPSKKAPAKLANTGPSTLYEANAFLWHGVSTFYTSSGKLIGTGAFEYAIPLVFFSGMYDPISSDAVGTRRVYTPQAIRTGVHSLPKGRY